MREVSISVDVYCNQNLIPNAYRLYIDDDLLTERTYIWNNSEQIVRENIIDYLTPGAHSFHLVPTDPKCHGFGFRNFTVDKQPSFIKDNQFTVN